MFLCAENHFIVIYVVEINGQESGDIASMAVLWL